MWSTGKVTHLPAPESSPDDSFSIDVPDALAIGDTYDCGDTYDSAALATGWPMEVDYRDESDPGCTYVTPVGAPSGVRAVGSDEHQPGEAAPAASG